MEKANLEQLTSFITADGSAIRELAGPAWTLARHQSSVPLVLLCCCAPAYSDDDTVMTGG
ncbi:MAG TPA: hypothetical protein VII87_00435 [Solirubrobacteraceae bacterium]